MGTAQDHDRLVYEVTDHPMRIPAGRVTDDGHYLIITLFDGYERNGVSLLDLWAFLANWLRMTAPPGP